MIQPLAYLAKKKKVSDVLSDDGRWVLQRLQTPIPADIQARIKGVPVSQNRDSDDVRIWPHSNTGNFTVKFVYEYLATPMLAKT